MNGSPVSPNSDKPGTSWDAYRTYKEETIKGERFCCGRGRRDHITKGLIRNVVKEAPHTITPFWFTLALVTF